MRILVTGGAGYIGSVVCRSLRGSGHETIVLDDLSAGHRRATDGSKLIVGDCGDRDLLAKVFAAGKVDGVVHMAASCLVGESMTDPARYYRNNFEKSLSLLDAMREAGVGRFVLSSTAAVYGEPESNPIPEDHPTRPKNPYGETKLALEKALRWYREAYGLSYASLRYFNAAGASADAALGEDHSPETHLIPNVLRAALREEAVAVYGTDYETVDGTAVRDYIHVEDLADAHVRALERIRSHPGGVICNLGNGEGISVREVIAAARRVTARSIAVHDQPRRAGDPARLVASAERARAELGWAPRSSRIETILSTAWEFMKSHPDGYEG